MLLKGLITVCLLSLSSVVWAIPLHSERGYGGALAGPAWASPAVIGLNPAAMPMGTRLDGPQVLLEGNLLQTQLSVLATRNGGVDPNTNAPYPAGLSETAKAGGYAGMVWPLPGNRVVIGLALQTPWQTDTDFRQDVDSSGLDIPTRYAAILFESSSLQLLPAVAVQVFDGLNLGASMTIATDRVQIVQAWDPMGTEGLGPGDDQPGFYVPYSNDVLVQGEMIGTHLEWTGGIWISRIPYVQIGASYTHRRSLAIEGSGLLEFSEFMGDVNIPAMVGMTFDLAPELRVGLSTTPELPVQASLAWGVEFWGSCCADREGDARLSVKHANGEVIGPEHGVIVEISDEVFIPRRLSNSTYLRAGLQVEVLPRWQAGLHVGVRTASVPDYAMNALQQDFDTREGGLHSSIQIGESLRLGASYTHRISTPRSVSNSAWDVHIITADDVPEYYVDERFSPQLPFTAGGDGQYAHSARLLSLRLELQL